MSVFFGAFTVFDRFRVDTIEVYSANKGEVRGLSQISDENLLILREELVQKDILRNNPFVENVEVAKKLPGTISLNFDMAVPIANIATSEGYIVLSETGKVLTKSREKDSRLPEMTYYQDFPFSTTNAGTFLNHSDILSAISFMKALSSIGERSKLVDIDSHETITITCDESTFLFSTTKDKDTQLYQLEKVVRELRRSGVAIKSLDLRYEKPVFVPQ